MRSSWNELKYLKVLTPVLQHRAAGSHAARPAQITEGQRRKVFANSGSGSVGNEAEDNNSRLHVGLRVKELDKCSGVWIGRPRRLVVNSFSRL
jgi:hypothetical protein